MPPLESGPVPSEYVVIFSRHMSPLQRHSLLHPCMPSADIWQLSRQHFFRQSDLVSSDLATVVFASSMDPPAESAAIACVKDLPGVKFVQQQRWYRRAVSVVSNGSSSSAPATARKLHSIIPSRVLAAKELWDKVNVFASSISVCLIVTL
jgi:hypothetical protein